MRGERDLCDWLKAPSVARTFVLSACRRAIPWAVAIRLAHTRFAGTPRPPFRAQCARPLVSPFSASHSRVGLGKNTAQPPFSSGCVLRCAYHWAPRSQCIFSKHFVGQYRRHGAPFDSRPCRSPSISLNPPLLLRAFFAALARRFFRAPLLFFLLVARLCSRPTFSRARHIVVSYKRNASLSILPLFGYMFSFFSLAASIFFPLLLHSHFARTVHKTRGYYRK